MGVGLLDCPYRLRVIQGCGKVVVPAGCPGPKSRPSTSYSLIKSENDRGGVARFFASSDRCLHNGDAGMVKEISPTKMRG